VENFICGSFSLMKNAQKRQLIKISDFGTVFIVLFMQDSDLFRGHPGVIEDMFHCVCILLASNIAWN
jgi:hypothetical protein